MVNYPDFKNGYIPFVPNPANASNVRIGGNNPPYSLVMLQEDFPQFTDEALQGINTELYIGMANSMILRARWGEWWRYAAGLCAAHFLTLAAQGNSGAAGVEIPLSVSGSAVGRKTSKSVDGVSVSYDYGVTDEALRDWGSFGLTSYGQQLATLGNICGMGGMYIW